MQTAIVRHHKDLRVWQESITLATTVYRVTSAMPPHEQFGLTAQLGRAACSISANIAEGAARNTTRDFAGALPWLEDPWRSLKHTCCYVSGWDSCSQQVIFTSTLGVSVACSPGGIQL